VARAARAEDGGNCDPEAGAVDSFCGVFVSSTLGDDDNGAGTKDKP
jgi:hypothetical protein